MRQQWRGGGQLRHGLRPRRERWQSGGGRPDSSPLSSRRNLEKEKHKKLNYLRKPEIAESSTSSSVEEVKRVLGHLFMKATAEELKVLHNVFDSGPGSNSWMAAFKNEIDKQESLKANLLGGSPEKTGVSCSCASS